MSNDKIETIGILRYEDTSDNIGKNTTAKIYILETILQQRKTKGLTLFLNIFFICKDLLKHRKYVAHKIAISSNPEDVRIGNKPYNSRYVKTEIIVPEEELTRIIELINKK